jgi:hypothetical protein
MALSAGNVHVLFILINVIEINCTNYFYSQILVQI